MLSRGALVPLAFLLWLVALLVNGHIAKAFFYSYLMTGLVVVIVVWLSIKLFETDDLLLTAIHAESKESIDGQE